MSFQHDKCTENIIREMRLGKHIGDAVIRGSRPNSVCGVIFHKVIKCVESQNDKQTSSQIVPSRFGPKDNERTTNL